jgi:GNAT superfamily N-acetyltransferase
MEKETYLADPCGASSLPFWKTEEIRIPEGMSVIREDRFDAERHTGADEPYFKLVHRLEEIPRAGLPAGFSAAACDTDEFARHIRACYAEEGVTAAELEAYRRRPVFDPDLWIAIRDGGGRIAASGIAELDTRIGEGCLEWIQVSPEYRRRGLGRYIVCELLRRMKDRAAFATVSGRVNNGDNPLALYLSCGFGHPVIWHITRDGE